MLQFFGSRAAICVAIAMLSSSAVWPVIAGARSTVQRDVEGYAIASCLDELDGSYLKERAYLNDQGDGWASVVIQRGKGDLDVFTAVSKAVKAELAKGGMAFIRDESVSGPASKPMPVLYCGEIIDTPRVRVAIETAIRRLTPAYRRR